jgi:hypothetical protein
MRIIGFLLGACIALAVLRMAVAALLVAMCGLLVCGALFRPAETISFLFLSVAIGLMQAHPVISLVALGLAALLAKVP